MRCALVVMALAAAGCAAAHTAPVGRPVPEVAAPTAPDAPFRARPPAPDASGPFVPSRVRSFSLPNGVRVFAYPSSGELASVSISMVAAPTTSLSDRRTLLPLAAAALAGSTRSFSDAQVRQLELEFAADVSSSWQRDQLTVEARFRGARIGDVLELLGSIVREPSLSEHEIEYRKSLRVNWLSKPADHPDAVAAGVLAELMFGPQSPYGCSLSERVEDVRSVTREEVAASYERLRDPRRMSIGVAGSYDDVELRPQIEHAFGALAPGSTAAAEPDAVAAPRVSRHVVLIDRPGATTARIQLGAPEPRLHGQDDDAALLLAQVLRSGSVGRLGALQTDQSLSDRFDVVYRNGLIAGTFVVSAEVPPSAVVAALRTIETATDSLRRDGPSEAELDAAKDRVHWQEAGGFERVSGITWTLVALSALGEDPNERLRTYGARVQAVTAADVRAVANRFLSRDATQIVVVGDVARIREPLARAGYAADDLRDASGRPPRQK
jgi:zinc protease